MIDDPDQRTDLSLGEATFALAQTAARMGYWEWNVATNGVTWSREMAGLFGATPDEFGGTFDEFLQRVHPEDRALVVSSVKTLAENGHLDMEHRVLLPDGSVRWISGRGQAFYDDSGRPYRAVGIGMEITARKEQQRMHDDFVAFASHELRGPLTPILGAARILQRMVEDSPERYEPDLIETVDMLRTEAQRMAEVVELFLDLSRLDATTGLNLELAPVELLRIVKGEVERAKSRFPGATIRLHAEERPLIVESDGARLRQVLSNLIENAAKYAGAEALIDVSLESCSLGYEVSVSDNGPGISAEDLPRVFERFFRGTGENVRKSKGSGVGLFLARQVMERLGGTLIAQSEPGQGAVFTLALPATPPGS